MPFTVVLDDNAANQALNDILNTPPEKRKYFEDKLMKDLLRRHVRPVAVKQHILESKPIDLKQEERLIGLEVRE